MKKLFLLIGVVLLGSCVDTDALRKEEALRAEKKQNEILAQIHQKWHFNPANFTEETYQIIQKWPEWNAFYNELLQKPQNNITAFRQKSKILVDLSEPLISTLPEVFNIPAIQSRFLVLNTKLKMFRILITLDNIPSERTLEVINDIQNDMGAIVSRMTSVLEKNKIQKEEGEAEMLQLIQGSNSEVKTDL